MALNPRDERFLWVGCALVAGAAFFASDTFYFDRVEHSDNLPK
jgi:hypothetical protein